MSSDDSPKPDHRSVGLDSDGLGPPRPRDASAVASPRDRNHAGPRRDARLHLRLTAEEMAMVDVAARHAGLSVSGYAADAVAAAATGSALAVSEPLRRGLADLVDARAQLRYLGTNVHLAVGALHRNGTPPSWLVAAVQDAATAVERIDAAALAVMRALR